MRKKSKCVFVWVGVSVCLCECKCAKVRSEVKRERGRCGERTEERKRLKKNGRYRVS